MGCRFCHLPFREDVIMGSPENDTRYSISVNVNVYENEKDKQIDYKKERDRVKEKDRETAVFEKIIRNYFFFVIYKILRQNICRE